MEWLFTVWLQQGEKSGHLHIIADLPGVAYGYENAATSFSSAVFFFFGVYRCLMRVAYWSIRSKHFFFFLKRKRCHCDVLRVYFMHTLFLAYYCWRVCVFARGMESRVFWWLGETMAFWRLNQQISHVDSSVRGWGGTFGMSAEQSVFERNTIKSRLRGWMDIQLCLLAHTGGVLELAGKTIRMEICVGLLTHWLNLTESGCGRRLGS